MLHIFNNFSDVSHANPHAGTPQVVIFMRLMHSDALVAGDPREGVSIFPLLPVKASLVTHCRRARISPGSTFAVAHSP
jgi:hypothetical protein